MGFNAASLKKAAETRKRNAEQKRLKAANNATGLATTKIGVGTTSTLEVQVDKETHIVPNDDWNTIPLNLAVERLADMKRAYDRAAQIVLFRQSKLPVVWTCWTQKHKSEVPKSVVAQCKGNIPDGKWVYQDNGAKDADGRIASEVCCSQLCYTVYQRRVSDQRNRDRGIVVSAAR